MTNVAYRFSSAGWPSFRGSCGRRGNSQRSSVASTSRLELAYGLPYPPLQTRNQQNGFTLMELLVVISLLAVLAGAAVMGYQGVEEQGHNDVTRFEMAEIREALLQFRRDSGTHDFPGQGIYDCEDLADMAIASRPANWPATIPAVNGSTKAAWVTWCQHPANFWMLFVDPLGDGWDADRKRGWKGPYLQRKNGLVNVPVNMPTGQPAVNDVWGIADAFQPSKPYLLLGMHTRQNTADVPDHHYDDRIVSLGENGFFDEPLPDPSSEPDPNPNPCQPHVFDATGKPLDDILCLLH